eukprot:GHVR01176098.1.p1 GENE.GHVR01176098.1~~GHVR01176098.1.p1  ORF type:complete len:180 (+),score=28.50 GHVR01176098.1:255-794(+)
MHRNNNVLDIYVDKMQQTRNREIKSAVLITWKEEVRVSHEERQHMRKALLRLMLYNEYTKAKEHIALLCDSRRIGRHAKSIFTIWKTRTIVFRLIHMRTFECLHMYFLKWREATQMTHTHTHIIMHLREQIYQRYLREALRMLLLHRDCVYTHRVRVWVWVKIIYNYIYIYIYIYQGWI